MALQACVSLLLTGGPFLSARDLSTSLRGGSRLQRGRGRGSKGRAGSRDRKAGKTRVESGWRGERAATSSGRTRREDRTKQVDDAVKGQGRPCLEVDVEMGEGGGRLRKKLMVENEAAEGNRWDQIRQAVRFRNGVRALLFQAHT